MLATQIQGSGVIGALNTLFEEHPKSSIDDEGQIKLPVEELSLVLQPFFPRIEDLTSVIALLADSNPHMRVGVSDLLVALNIFLESTSTYKDCHTTLGNCASLPQQLTTAEHDHMHGLDNDPPSHEIGAYVRVSRHCEDLDRRLDDVVVRLDALALEDLPAIERRVAHASREIVGLVPEFKVETELAQTSRQVVDFSRDQHLLQTQLKKYNSSLSDFRKMQVSTALGQTDSKPESAQAGVRFLNRNIAANRSIAMPENPDILEVSTQCIFNIGEDDEDDEEDTCIAIPTFCTPLNPILGANDDELDTELTDLDEMRSVRNETVNGVSKLDSLLGGSFPSIDQEVLLGKVLNNHLDRFVSLHGPLQFI
ncbi:hypothetical protein BD769DRAFT_1387039 [Suillus cothurnatus]|nr:hypothetical protein BD769DRAFT_1387039 [Suillus cothurnatus]